MEIKISYSSLPGHEGNETGLDMVQERDKRVLPRTPVFANEPNGVDEGHGQYPWPFYLKFEIQVQNFKPYRSSNIKYPKQEKFL